MNKLLQTINNILLFKTVIATSTTKGKAVLSKTICMCCYVVLGNIMEFFIISSEILITVWHKCLMGENFDEFD